MTQTLHRFFYHSQLADSYGAVCVSDIIKTARLFNATHGITGVLVFDGTRFCQYFEGPETAVRHLIASIQKDPRHTAFTPLLDAPLTGPRVYEGWVMAYCLLEGMPFIEALLQKTPQEALEFLHASRNMLDMA
ncbi:BLUF domain-containing protein [Lampropedia aestuarii]|uniref:BLUF domain-containing protein n=1 Tax=Lampropedia aestuarii TaxID=2562762 RepID=A0A4S5BSW0_9BURK|nr:BLUF domain-containing protein [Lampropedia aestuarii]MDH5856991.1 BLUF domain-containing protein [Lampropedia aestuarii]THJ33008.1 BLUF domain-containing protein [Lampropedia aestuarii]